MDKLSLELFIRITMKRKKELKDFIEFYEKRCLDNRKFTISKEILTIAKKTYFLNVILHKKLSNMEENN